MDVGGDFASTSPAGGGCPAIAQVKALAVFRPPRRRARLSQNPVARKRELDGSADIASLDRSKSLPHALNANICGGRQDGEETNPDVATMSARVTLNDIAESAGVSRATVSLVLRKNPLVARATAERVQASIASLGYVYDRAAANLRARCTHTVGLVVCEITNPFYADLTAGIDEALDHAGWVAFLCNTAESPARQDRFIERMREHRVDGLLLCPAEGTKAEIIDRLRGYGLPMVQVLRQLGRREADHVGADFRSGMTLAVEHFIRLGHRRIAFVGGGRHASPALDRAQSYRDTLVRYGLPVGPIVSCIPTREEGERAVASLMRGRSDDPTAIICHNDLCAIGVLVGLSDKGMRGGRDCGVIGFDNIPEAALSRPALTTIDIGARQIGVEAARLLLRRIEAPKGAPEDIILPPRLVIRASCGSTIGQAQSIVPP